MLNANRWLNSLHLGFFIMKHFLLITLSIIAVTLGFNYENVFADSPADIVYTIDSTNENTAYTFCDNSGSVSCSGFNYVLINYNFTTNSNFYFNLTIDNVANRVYWPKVQYNQVFALNNPTKVAYGVASTGLQSGQTITITLSASQGCPSCPTCPEQLDPNRSPIMDDFHNVFINTMLSIIPITAIIFVVWFFIDMLSSLVFGRGK